MKRRLGWGLVAGCGCVLALEVPSALGPMGEDLGGPYAPWSSATALHASFDAQPGRSPEGRVANADAEVASPAPSELIAARGFGD